MDGIRDKGRDYDKSRCENMVSPKAWDGVLTLKPSQNDSLISG
jgi:hypothetical protein